jgi:hypothetical protein
MGLLAQHTRAIHAQYTRVMVAPIYTPNTASNGQHHSPAFGLVRGFHVVVFHVPVCVCCLHCLCMLECYVTFLTSPRGVQATGCRPEGSSYTQLADSLGSLLVIVAVADDAHPHRFHPKKLAHRFKNW